MVQSRASLLEPVQSLLSKAARNAKRMHCTLVLRLRLQFFHNLRRFCNQAKLRLTSHCFGMTLNVCRPVRSVSCTLSCGSRMSRTPWLNGTPTSPLSHSTHCVCLNLVYSCFRANSAPLRSVTSAVVTDGA